MFDEKSPEQVVESSSSVPTTLEKTDTHEHSISSRRSSDSTRHVNREATRLSLRRTISSRKPPDPRCPRCKQGLTDLEGQPCELHEDYETDPNIVLWDGDDDPERPLNWSLGRKLMMTFVGSLFVTSVSWSSSTFGPATKIVAEEYGVSSELMQLAITFHILGFAFGPLVFGPASEVFGRTLPFFTGLAGMTIFQIPQSLAGNVRTILICRFFEGVFGSSIFSVVSGMFVDIWDPINRGVALALSATSINLGSTVAPIFSGFLVENVGWRWTSWITCIYCGTLLVLGAIFISEPYEPVLLARKARRLRFETKNFALHARSEETPIDITILVQKYLTKPVRIFVQEPILIALTAYLTLVYGILYLSYQALPFSFQKRGWSPAVSELPFIAIVLGILSAWAMFAVFVKTWYKKQWSRTQSAVPETRLPPMILGSFILPPALWWFGWSQDTHWACQVIAAYFIGLGLLLIFDTGIVYLVDVYLSNTNSAMSIHVVIRSIVSCSFPLFAGPMYTNLGTPWASTILGFACLVMVAAPLILWKWGHTIRSWSRFAVAK